MSANSAVTRLQVLARGLGEKIGLERELSMTATLLEIRQLVENGHYQIGEHTLLHMMEEGFDKEHCVGAVLGGRLLETYPVQQRYLIAGRFHLSERNTCPLHVVCEIQRGEVQGSEIQRTEKPRRDGPSDKGKTPDSASLSVVRFVTAYIPRPPDWISPHVRARRQTKWK